MVSLIDPFAMKAFGTINVGRALQYMWLSIGARGECGPDYIMDQEVVPW